MSHVVSLLDCWAREPCFYIDPFCTSSIHCLFYSFFQVSLSPASKLIPLILITWCFGRVQRMKKKKKSPQIPSRSFPTPVCCTTIKKHFRCCNNFVQTHFSTLTLKSLFTAKTKHCPKALGQKSTAWISTLRLCTSV